MTGIKTLGFIFVALVAIHTGAGTVTVQKPSGVSAPQQQPDAKAEQIVKDALEVMGGQNYLNVRSVVGKGQYTQYQDGVSGRWTSSNLHCGPVLRICFVATGARKERR